MSAKRLRGQKGLQSKEAVALKYDREADRAPKVTARGKGFLAARIIETAKKHDIPIHEDPDLVEMFAAIELNEEIPPELYTVVAEVLAMIYRVNKKAQ